MHLVQNDELVQVVGQIEFRLSELGAVLFRFQVEVYGFAVMSDLERQRGLPRLAWSEQRHGWEIGQRFDELRIEITVEHGCNYGVLLLELQ